jgi:SulP family sulfate permease
MLHISYSNAAAGLFGGLQNYMAYSNSVIYSKSNGKGKGSSLAIVAVSILIFIYGPMMASYVPRCMAGTLLLHVGIDLFLEGVIDSYKDYDNLEYSGILLIMIVMVTFGMDAALVAGVVAALSTFLAQSIVYQDPIRGAMSGARLQSSAWDRSTEAQRILLDPKKGRQRIYVIQLQGHIFFGNVVKMSEDIKRRLNDKRRAGDEPAVGKFATIECGLTFCPPCQSTHILHVQSYLISAMSSGWILLQPNQLRN